MCVCVFGYIHIFLLKSLGHFNSFMPSGLYYLIFLDRSFSNRRCVWLFLLLPCFIEIPVFKANSVDPDQTPRSGASDPGLYWDTRLK